MSENFNCSQFGHTVNLVGKDYIVILGGAVGSPQEYKVQDSNFIFDISEKKWIKGQNLPSARAAHAACSFNSNHIVIFGGIVKPSDLSQNQLLMYIINQNQWQIVPVSGESPSARYGHTLCYNKPNLILYGGSNEFELMDDIWILNTVNSNLCWQKLNLEIKPPSRIYHTANICQTGPVNGMMIIFGGRCIQNNILNDIWGLVKHRDNSWEWIKAPLNLKQIKGRYQHCCVCIEQFLFVIGGKGQDDYELNVDVYDTQKSNWISLNTKTNILRHGSVFHQGIIYIFGGFDQQNKVKTEISYFLIDQLIKDNKELQQSYNQKKKSRSTTPERYQNYTPIKNKTVVSNYTSNQKDQMQNNIRLGNQVEVAFNLEMCFPTIKKIKINSLQEESRKIGIQEIIQNPLTQLQIQTNRYLNSIINDQDYEKQDTLFIQTLCKEMITILQKEQTLLQLRTPMKVFGDIRGNLNQLIKMFENYGYPHDIQNGDIERMNYLFLGNYIDSGNNNIELILLLFCLKIKYPFQIHFLRGNHEDSNVNQQLGYALECKLKYEDNSVFEMINEVFEYLPLAAILDEKYFCVHAGIGESFNIDQIQKIQRPIKDIQQQTQLIQNLIKSEQIDENEINNFLQQNNLQAIIRSNKYYESGFNNFKDIIYTVFSENQQQNQSAILIIKKNGQIINKFLNNQIEKWINRENVTPLRQN